MEVSEMEQKPDYYTARQQFEKSLDVTEKARNVDDQPVTLVTSPDQILRIAPVGLTLDGVDDYVKRGGWVSLSPREVLGSGHDTDLVKILHNFETNIIVSPKRIANSSNHNSYCG